jgi:cell division protein FtsQ
VLVTPAHTRHGGRRVLVVTAIVVSAVVVLAGGAYAALHSRLLAASTVSVTGARHETLHQVIDGSGLASAPPMVSVDPGLVTQRLEVTFPWVASAVVTLHWPHTVSIAVTERTAVAEVAGPHGSMVLVDVTGRRLGPPAPGEALPHLQFAAPVDQPAASPTTLSGAAEPGLLVAATLPPAFKAQVAVVQVATDGWVTLHLTTPVSFDLGPASDLGAKYEDVAAVIAHTTLHVGDVVDVSVPQAMTVTGP